MITAVQSFAAELFDTCDPLLSNPQSVLHAEDLSPAEAQHYYQIACRLRDHLERVQIPALVGRLVRR